MDNKASYYMIVPATVWTADIRDKAKLCYGHISVLANKEGYCYANNTYLAKQLGVSPTSASQYISELVELGVIRTHIIYKEGTKEVEQRRIYLVGPTEDTKGTEENFNGPTEENFRGPTEENFRDINTSNNTTSKNKRNKKESIERVYTALCKLYPKNRINSKGPILKYLETKSENELKQIVTNVTPYLELAGEYVKNLRNYLEHECWTNEWIESETKIKNNTNGKSTKNNAASFKDRNKGFYD